MEFSTLQQSASHLTPRVGTDEAFMVGGVAVRAVDEGGNGKIVVIDRVSGDPYQYTTGTHDAHKIANDKRLVPRNWVTEDGTYMTEGFTDYVKPLVQDNYPSVMVNGIPEHLYMKG